jgi:hypothetical protein
VFDSVVLLGIVFVVGLIYVPMAITNQSSRLFRSMEFLNDKYFSQERKKEVKET